MVKNKGGLPSSVLIKTSFLLKLELLKYLFSQIIILKFLHVSVHLEET